MTTFLRPKPKPVPDLQRAHLRFVRDFLRDNKVSPSIDEIAAASGYNRSTVRDALRGLMRKGYLQRGPGRFRNLVITTSGQTVLRKG